MINDTVRSTPTNSIFVKLPDIGQDNPNYPEIRDSLIFEWYRDGVYLENYITDTMRIDNFSDNDTGTYYCKIHCRHPYLNELVLETDSFKIINQANIPPVLTLREDDQKRQRILKGGTSNPVRFIPQDDKPLDHYVSMNYNTYEVIKFPEHLEYLGNISNITVRDTSETWFGSDTLIVEYCDFEGGCVQDTVFYTVYDLLYAPPILNISSDSSENLNITWDIAYYDDKIEKPDGYYIVRDTCPSAAGLMGFTTIDTLNIPGINTDSYSFTIPQSNSDYMLFIKLHAQQNDTLVSTFASMAMLPIPVKADTIINFGYDSSSVTLSWAFNSDTDALGLTNYNAIYYSINNGDFQWLANTTFNMDTYTHENINTDNTVLKYKLVKRAVSLDLLAFDFELPYLESNIVTISTEILDNDASLLSLTVSERILNPEFNPNTTNYNVNVENRVESIVISAITNHVNATITGTGTKSLNVGENIFEIIVTAEDGISTKTYRVIVIRSDNIGLINIEGQDNIKIYPNPVTDELILESNLNISSIIITDNTGSIVYIKKTNVVENKYFIDVSNLKSGVYFIQLNSSTETLTKKIIKN